MSSRTRSCRNSACMIVPIAVRTGTSRISMWLQAGIFGFFWQAEDGIRYHCVTGVQTCALPISCPVCRRYSRAYLRHLFAAGEITGAILATHHNVHFYLDIMRQIREAIEFGNLANFSSEMHARYAEGPA